jgi:hypothetical protein
MTGIFAQFQPWYAEHRIATFPVSGTKVPRVRCWQKVGLKGSAALAAKFHDADALGYLTGRRSRVTVLDIDTTDSKIAEDAIRRHGQPVIITRTASGKFHLLYRYNGERRRIRPWPELPIDILGDGGQALAAPSRIANGSYEIIHGHLYDLDWLLPMAGIETPKADDSDNVTITSIPIGRRNNQLWRFCMSRAPLCADRNALVAKANAFNLEHCAPPLSEDEVMSTAASAWGYTETGQNRFGQHGAFFPIEEVASLVLDPDAFYLLAFLRAHNGPWATFMCTNTLADKFDWGLRRLRAARSRLVELGYLTPMRQAGRDHPALYRWADYTPKGSRGQGEPCS